MPRVRSQPHTGQDHHRPTRPITEVTTAEITRMISSTESVDLLVEGTAAPGPRSLRLSEQLAQRSARAVAGSPEATWKRLTGSRRRGSGPAPAAQRAAPPRGAGRVSAVGRTMVLITRRSPRRVQVMSDKTLNELPWRSVGGCCAATASGDLPSSIESVSYR
jgi:hypothetical protein